MMRAILRNKRGGGLNTIHAQLPIAKDVYAMDNLHEAALKVIANKGSHGIDGMTVEMLEMNLKEHLLKLQWDLMTETFTPKPPREVDFPKGDGRYRTLMIPTVLDRVAQQALRNVIDPPYEMMFMDCSYGYRKNRDAHTAITKVMHYISEGNLWIVKGDISQCFDMIPHDRLIKKVSEVIKDDWIINLIKKMIYYEEGHSAGVPQGSVIGPLLSNIYLHDFDRYMVKRKLNLVRYADDYVVLFKEEQEAHLNSLKSRGFLADQLRLKTEDKDGHGGVAHRDRQFNFLGYTFYNGGIKPSAKAPVKLILNIEGKLKRERKRNYKALSEAEIIEHTNTVIRGWTNYYSIGNGAEIFKTADVQVRIKVREWIDKDALRPTSNQKLKDIGLTSAYEEYSEIRRQE